jgi:hypothetical protein
VPVGLLEAETTGLDDPGTAPSGTGPSSLFEEARRRRRRRVLLGAAIVGVVLVLGMTFLALGGAGHFSGTPPSHSGGRGPAGGLTSPQPPPSEHGPVTGGRALCDKAIVRLDPPSTAANASLLPCYRAPALPGRVATVPPP